MNDGSIRTLYPISWISESPGLMEFLWDNLVLPAQRRTTQAADEFFVADFASGENDQIPVFFIKMLPDFLAEWSRKHHTFPLKENHGLKRLTTYSTDLHGLRLDGLLGLFEENGIQNRARGVHARLEAMTTEAALRPSDIEFVQSHPEEKTWLDDHIMNQGRLPDGCFQFGVLNNDVVGYLFEYYKTYTDAQRSLLTVRSTMKDGAMLIVTQPCSLYSVDNIEVLRKCDFGFISGMDVDLKTREVTSLDPECSVESLSRLGHYTFLLFQAD
ncbi:MAG: hypothetical protein JSW05_12545 [Candidatus Thorarchaeota archaeon]|nr:MAG: hypothetical protein JSW05_12545 [Candidatus Thorarchaeota archaeon]